jgi:hypothetical protein
MDTARPRSLAGVLTHARDLIADPKKWTRDAYARTAKGVITGIGDEDAECFCAQGAIQRAARLSKAVPAYDATEAARKALPAKYSHIENFNDAHGTTHADVMAFFDSAIALASSPRRKLPLPPWVWGKRL